MCTVLLAVSLGICYSFGVFFTSLQEEFGWSRATTSSIFSVYLVFAGIFSVIGGWTTDKLGPRPVVIAMGILTGLSLLATSEINSSWQLFLTYGILLPLGTGAMYIIAMSTVSRWFLQRRATAVGIVGAGALLGTVIIAPVSARLIDAYDWRDAYAILGFVAWALIIPIAFLIKKEPSDNDSEFNESNQLHSSNSEGLQLADSLKTRTFWLLFTIWFTYSFCLHLVMSHLVRNAEDAGITPIQAASILSLLTGMAIPARLAFGFLADKLDKRWMGIIMALLHTIAMFWLVGADELWMFCIFSVLYGIAYGGIDPPVTSLIGDTLGTRSIGSIMGILMIAWGLGSATGPFFGGYIFDIADNYNFAFFFGGLVMLPAALCIWFLRVQSFNREELQQ